jgi:hypothetical protein
VIAAGQQGGRAAYNDLAHLLLAMTLARAWSDAEPIAATIHTFTREVSSARTELLIRKAVRTIVDTARSGDVDRPSACLADAAAELADR